MQFPFESLTAQTYLDFVFDIPKNFISSRTHTTAKPYSFLVTSGSEDRSAATGASLSLVLIKWPMLERFKQHSNGEKEERSKNNHPSCPNNLKSISNTSNIFCGVFNSPLPCECLQGCSDDGEIELLSDLKLKMLNMT